MQCPHCRSEVEVKSHSFALGEDPDGTWQVSSARCPACDRLIVDLCLKDVCTYPAWPAGATHARPGDDVPAGLATEFLTASQVIVYSPEASAAIGRRLLQKVLNDQAGVGGGGLADQIKRALLSPALPPYVKEALQTYTDLARIGAGNDKNLHPEALAPVEPGEAEWLLDVHELLFELYFVQPARLRRKRDALEETIGRLTTEEPETAGAVEPPNAHEVEPPAAAVGPLENEAEEDA
ncbi:MAG: hypothetical protein JXA87_14245 [Thermoleophilia bacterium]|nr:hypothetical protein [Thermoleophilia bacterium]